MPVRSVNSWMFIGKPFRQKICRLGSTGSRAFNKMFDESHRVAGSVVRCVRHLSATQREAAFSRAHFRPGITVKFPKLSQITRDPSEHERFPKPSLTQRTFGGTSTCLGRSADRAGGGDW